MIVSRSNAKNARSQELNTPAVGSSTARHRLSAAARSSALLTKPVCDDWRGTEILGGGGGRFAAGGVLRRPGGGG